MIRKMDTVVVDTSAFIKNAAIQELAENVYTVQNVIDEVTSKPQLRRLIILPYELKIRDPQPDNVKYITDFSKKTGDYPSLSATDILVLALTYELECQLVGKEHLKTEPTLVRTNTVGSFADVKQLVGFYLPAKTSGEEVEENKEGELKSQEGNEEREEKCEESSGQYGTVDSEYTDEEEEDSDDDPDAGWITSENIDQAKKDMGGYDDIVENAPTVACITSDFAMQNVLRQIGLHVMSADGKLIKHIRTYILRCYACFKTTSVMTKVFCPKCGNQTLKRVAVTLNEDGSLQMHFSRKPLSSKGKQQSLPMPRSGKHANNDIRFEDQPVPQQKPSKLARAKNNPLDPDYLAGLSPFVTRDTNSRAAMLGINYNWGQRGPSRTRGRGQKTRTHRRK